MRILVTGATGFVGSHLVDRLVEKGHEVAIFCRPTSNKWRISAKLPHVVSIEGTFEDVEASEPALLSFRPEAVYHLGWWGVQNTHRNVTAQVEVNIKSSLQLMTSAQKAGCVVFVGLGSQAEYGPLNCVIAEDAPTQPTTLYGASKLSTNHILRVLSHGTGMRFHWVRLFSCYGPRDHATWMIPHVIMTLMRGDKPALTEGRQLWDFIYVDDVIDALCAFTEVRPEGVYNLGSGISRPLCEMVTLIRDAINPLLPLGFGEVPYRPDQVMHLQANISRLSKATGWRPMTSLEVGIKKTVEWFGQVDMNEYLRAEGIERK